MNASGHCWPLTISSCLHKSEHTRPQVLSTRRVRDSALQGGTIIYWLLWKMDTTPWYTVLGVSEDAEVEQVEAAAAALLDKYSAMKTGLTSLRLQFLADFGIDTSGCSDPAPIEEAYAKVARAFRHYQTTNPAYLAVLQEREAQKQAEELRQMPQYEPTHVRHSRLVQGGRWEVQSETPPPWANEPAPQFCDGRYRCLVCPGGLGYQGQGFQSRGQVPCTNYSEHMLVLRAYAHDGFVCSSELDADALSDLFESGASIEGITSATCKFKVCSPSSAPTDDHRPLAQNIRCEPCPKRHRNRQTILRWCTGVYHCPTCNFTATRPCRLGCADPDAHIPKLHPHIPLDKIEVLHSGNVEGCKVCQGMSEVVS